MSTAYVQPQPAPEPAPPAAVEHFAHIRGKFLLWTGVLGGPIIWSLQLLAGYAVSRFSSEHRWLTGVHHGVSVAAIVAAAACALVALREWRRIGAGEPRGSEPGIPGRSRFMAALGVVTSAYFAVVILAQWLPVFFLSPDWY